MRSEHTVFVALALAGCCVSSATNVAIGTLPTTAEEAGTGVCHFYRSSLTSCLKEFADEECAALKMGMQKACDKLMLGERAPNVTGDGVVEKLRKQCNQVVEAIELQETNGAEEEAAAAA